MEKQLQLGIMGTNYICLRHGEAFESLPGVKIAAVADPDEKRPKEFVVEYRQQGSRRS